MLNDLEIMYTKLFSLSFRFQIFFHFSLGINHAVHMLSIQEFIAGTMKNWTFLFHRKLISSPYFFVAEQCFPLHFVGVEWAWVEWVVEIERKFGKYLQTPFPSPMLWESEYGCFSSGLVI